MEFSLWLRFKTFSAIFQTLSRQGESITCKHKSNNTTKELCQVDKRDSFKDATHIYS